MKVATVMCQASKGVSGNITRTLASRNIPPPTTSNTYRLATTYSHLAARRTKNTCGHFTHTAHHTASRPLAARTARLWKYSIYLGYTLRSVVYRTILTPLNWCWWCRCCVVVTFAFISHTGKCTILLLLHTSRTVPGPLKENGSVYISPF